MKKKTKNLLILTVFLVVLVAGYFALDLLPQKAEEVPETPNESIAVTEFTAEDIASYCYSNSNYEAGFIVTGEGYTHYRDGAFPVKEAGVTAQLEAIGGLTALQVVEGTDRAEYGLDSPEVTIDVTLIDGTERTFFIGDSALFEAADYLLDIENNIIYLVDENLYAEFSCTLSSLIQQEEKTEVSSNQIIDVTVENTGVTTMYIAYDETKEQPWQLTTAEGIFDGDTEAVRDAVSMYNSYSLGNTVEYNCTDFAPYGLDNPVTTVTVHYREKQEEDLENGTGTENTVGAEIKTLTFEFGSKDADSNETYVRINGSAYVYGMSAYYVEGLSVFDLEELKYQPEEGTETTE